MNIEKNRCFKVGAWTMLDGLRGISFQKAVDVLLQRCLQVFSVLPWTVLRAAVKSRGKRVNCNALRAMISQVRCGEVIAALLGSFHLKNATLHVYPITIWIGHSCLLLKSTYQGTVIIGQYQYKHESVGLRYPLALATGDASLTCQAETSTFTSSSAVCEPRCKTKVMEVAFFRKGTATHN